MKISAIICEYNPFHNGHKYQIATTRFITNCDAVVGLMSGNFVQRGDVAIFDKHTRAIAAILSGIDLLLELAGYIKKLDKKGAKVVVSNCKNIYK